MPELIDILARPTWDHLDARLRDAAARNPNSAPLVEVIRAPVRTLELLWRDAVPALRGDPLAAERLAVTLQAASDAAALVAVAVAALEQNKTVPIEPRPGLVRLRALAILIASTVRAQPPAQALYAKLVIGGLALQCGPAELLARLEPYGASPETYDNLIRLSVPPIVAAGVASRVYLRGHARDPAELARWRCIFELLDFPGQQGPPGDPSSDPDDPAPDPVPLIRLSATAPPSTGSLGGIAHADGITAVRVASDGKVELAGAFPQVDVETEPPLDEAEHAIVGVTAAQTVELGFDIEAEPALIRARFRSEVAWVGFVERDRIERANAIRAAIRSMLAGIDKLPCVAREPGATAGELLPNYDSDAWPIPEAPPRTATNQVPASSPTAGDDDGDVRPPDRIAVVALRVATVDGPPPPSREEVGRLIQAIGYRFGVALDVVTLPWVEDAAAVLSSPPEGEDDPRVPGLLEALARTAARTPGREAALWIAVVPGKSPLAVASDADAATGIGIATASGLPCCISRLLEPAAPPAPQPAVAAPSYLAAGRLRVPAACGVDRPGRAPRTRTPVSRLRMIGRLVGNSVELLEPPREEVRAAGPGSPEDTGIIAVALDRRGGELTRAAIRGHRTTGPSTFAALIAISPEVEAVELRRAHAVLVRVERAPEPTAAELTLDAATGRVTATWTMPSAVRPVALTVEISATGDNGGADDWVPLAELHTCADQAQLPLWRLDRAARARLVACDGWNAIAGEPVDLPQGTEFGPCAIRRVNERTLWAELPGGTVAEWSTPVDHTEEGRRLDLTAAAHGEVRLDAANSDGPFLTDVLDLEHRDVYRRA
jgi:hypothetical protein